MKKSWWGRFRKTFKDRQIVLVIVGILLIVGLVSWIIYDQRNSITRSTNNQTQQQNPNTEGDPTTPQSLLFSVPEVNQSSVSGTLRIEALDNNRIQVILEMVDEKEQNPQKRPAFIQKGTCVEPGDTVYPLNLLESGYSQTVLFTSFENFQNQLPLIIAVHVSDSQLNQLVSCATLVLS